MRPFHICEQQYLPSLRSPLDPILVAEIGYYAQRGEPLTIKGLLLLNLGAPATVHRSSAEANRGHAIYFEEFTRQMVRNFETNQSVCVLAVRSGLLFWLLSLFRGQFKTPPAIRLHGVVGLSRAATDDEIALWRRRVHRLRLTRGHEIVWANMRTVRDVTFTRADAIHIGEMTRDCWARFDGCAARSRV